MTKEFNRSKTKPYNPLLLILLIQAYFQQELSSIADLFVFLIQYLSHSDHLGSASLITDCDGYEYQRIEYTPYGETWVEKTSNVGLDYLPYKFTGKEMDEETGLYYYGARYLDPKYSRWISVDPALGEYVPSAGKSNEADKLPGMGGIFNTVNLSLYHYAGNNPIKYVDPDGRTSRDEYAYQLMIQGEKNKARAMENKAADENQGFNYNTIKEFFEMFSGEIKVGIGLNLSFIKEVGVDLFSIGGSFSKDGYKDFSTSSISNFLFSFEKRCYGDKSSTFLDPGEKITTIGPISITCSPDYSDPEFDVVLSWGFQCLVGVTFSISGKECLDYLKKKYYMMRYFDVE